MRMCRLKTSDGTPKPATWPMWRGPLAYGHATAERMWVMVPDPSRPARPPAGASRARSAAVAGPSGSGGRSVPVGGLRVRPGAARGAVDRGDVVEAPRDLGRGVGRPVGALARHLRAGQGLRDAVGARRRVVRRRVTVGLLGPQPLQAGPLRAGPAALGGHGLADRAGVLRALLRPGDDDLVHGSGRDLLGELLARLLDAVDERDLERRRGDAVLPGLGDGGLVGVPRVVGIRHRLVRDGRRGLLLLDDDALHDERDRRRARLGRLDALDAHAVEVGELDAPLLEDRGDADAAVGGDGRLAVRDDVHRAVGVEAQVERRALAGARRDEADVAAALD